MGYEQRIKRRNKFSFVGFVENGKRQDQRLYIQNKKIIGKN